MSKEEEYMQMALDLAKQAEGQVEPNPLVGCVIVKDGQIVSKGYHQKYGEAHAEVNAINALATDIDSKDCELYVTLEPCSHHGKTPPCVDLIVKKGFKKVVIAALDPNPLVNGNGVKKLKLHGIPTEVGVLEEEALWLNRRFYTFHDQQRPFYILKWAQTADGFISKLPVPATRQENMISGQIAQEFTHALRANVMAIMVGKNTVLSDNPQLTTRLVSGKNPLRVFVDRDLEVPLTAKIYDGAAKTVVFNRIKEGVEEHVTFKKIDFDMNVLEQMSKVLHGLHIQTVLVEGGRKLLNDFIQQHMFDEILVIENPNLLFKTGVPAPKMNLSGVYEKLGDERLYRFYG